MCSNLQNGIDENSEQSKLIKAFKEGNINAFEKLFHIHHQKLYSYVFSLLKSKEDTEEIVQDAFIKIWENRSSFKEEYTFSAFLFKIAKNAFLNHNRKSINKRMFEKYYHLINEIDDNQTEEYTLFRETQNLLKELVNELPPKRREIFILSKYEMLSRKEIAEKLNISIITVDSQLLKATKKIKEELKKYGILFLL